MGFIVIIGQIMGGNGHPFKTYWSSDMEERKTLKSAISHGFKTRGSDDFRIGEVTRQRLKKVSWMGERFFDAEEVIDTAEQLGMKF